MQPIATGAGVSEADVTAYEQQGVVCLRGVISPRWLDRLSTGIDENLASPGPYAKRYTPAGSPGLFFGDYCNWARITGYREFLFESGAAALAGQLMRSRTVRLFHEHVLVKEPGTREETPWHHDQPYWTVDGTQVCSLWVPLDPVGADTCPEFAAGSHRWGAWYTPRRFVDHGDHPSEDPNFRPVPDIAADRGSFSLLSWDLSPGDCIAFHALTLHGAPGNAGSSRRRAFAVRFTGDDARYALRPGFMSPPPQPGAPDPGEPMGGNLYPLLWQMEPAE